MKGIALKTVVRVYSSCSDLCDLLWRLFLFDMFVGLRHERALWNQDGVNFGTVKWAELHSFCLLPGSSSEGSFFFPLFVYFQ